MQRTISTAAWILALMCLIVAAADAAPGFSNKDIDGPTTFEFEGFVTVPVPGGTATVPAASIGRFVADGNGTLADGVRTLVVGGTTLRQTFTCSYNVDADGTGDATCIVLTDGAPSTETFDFVIIERKKAAFFTGTNPGVTISGRTKRQQ